jgi:hypothetical protein
VWGKPAGYQEEPPGTTVDDETRLTPSHAHRYAGWAPKHPTPSMPCRRNPCPPPRRPRRVGSAQVEQSRHPLLVSSGP